MKDKLKKLSEVMNFAELADEIDDYDLNDTFRNVINRIYADVFAEEIAEMEKYERAEQHREDMFFEKMLGGE
jgi:hypothetical protein